MACCGDVPTLESLAAVDLLRRELPNLKIRVVNVVDLMTLQSHTTHPHGFTDEQFDALFTKDKPVIFAYHGYPYLIHRLTYKRTNHENFHVHGFQEEGTTTTPFDMAVMNGIDRFHLAMAALTRLPKLGLAGEQVIQRCRQTLDEHARYVREYGEDMPLVSEWRWPYGTAAGTGD
jgi:xylulose-5-phosphate/fructose-6-phosphate phosphoketolase